MAENIFRIWRDQVDLAAQRGHMGCEKLLAEYHLHQQTTFDSMLFLASVFFNRRPFS